MTPSERRARALALKQQRENRNLYQQYLTQKEEYDRRVEQERLNALYEENKVKNQNFFVRAGHTIGDIAANVITGAVKGLEGIYDLGAGIVGAVGGIFDKGFQDDVKKHISYDWTMETFGNDWQEALKYSYTKNGGIVESAASGIGQMLPSVAVTIATGGAGAPAAVSQMASLATLGASAAGNSTEEAFNDGAGYYAGLGYGLASGAVEMATEKMFGGFGKLAGAGYLDNATRSIAKQGVARVAKEAVEEGVEEIVAELANPALKAIYKGGEAFQEYGDADYWKGVGEAGLIGGLTSMAYGQTVGRVLHSSGKYADVNEALAEVDSLAQKARNLSETGKLYEKAKNGKVNSDTIHDSMVENLRLIEQTVKKVDESKRAKFIKQAHLTDVVNPDGSIKSEFAMSRGLSDMVAQQSTEGQETAQSPLASQPKQYRTAFVDERVIKEALDRGGATAFVGEMTTEQARDFGDFTKVFGKLANKSNGFLKFVVGENVTGNAYIDPQTGVVVMGVDQFGRGTSGVDLANAVITSDMWQKSAIHEVKHSTEGTKQDSKLNAHLYEDNAVFVEARDSFLHRGYFEERVGQDTQKAGEYLDSLMVKFDDVMRNKPKNVSMEEHITANLTSQEIQDYRTAQSEIAAIAAENVLGNESFIKKLLRKDTNFAQKVLNRIMDMKEAFASLKSKEARNAYTYLNKAEKLYLKAIEEVGARFQKRRIIGIRRLEEGEEVDASPQSEYNGEEVVVQHSRKDSLINRTFPTYKESAGSEANTLATRWAHRADIQAGDQTLISYHDNWYVVQKFDDSDLGYQIMERIAKKDYDKIAEDIKRNGASGRIQSIQRAFTDFAQFDKQRDSARRAESSPHSLQIEHGGENSEVLRDSKTATPRGQTQNDGGGDSKSRRSSKQGLKYSFKEVSESALADLQGERDLALQEEKRTQKVLDSIEGYAEQKEKLYKVLNDKTASDYAVNAAMEEYAQWEKESGYGEAYKANYEASRKANELRREVERMGEELSKKLTAKKFTTEEISGYVQKAIRKFHTTPYLNRASYLLTTGSMLDFSDGQGYRVQDHREISEILNLPDYAEYSTGMIMFMNMGNIRLQTYGIDIAAMPNDKQVSALRGIIQNVMNEYDEFVVDFSKSNGNSDGSITYPQGISSARIISDIKKYFETGVLPEEPSDISRFRYSLKIGDETVGTQGKYNFNTESERVLKDIILQNDIENFLPKGLSKDFIRAIRSYGNFAFPRLYRGMEAAEFENLKKNGYIKSKGEYNFSNQQGETFFSRDVREAFSYATGFAPAGIREKFFEQGQPAYIIEVGNFGDLNFKYNSVKESSTKKEVDTKYITRILELRYNQSDKKVYIKDVGIDGMNSANGEAIHGEPIFVKDKTTGQILYAVQDEEGYETGAYISEAEPGLIVDYNKLKNAPQYEVDFRTKAANISGNEADLIPYDGESRIKHSLKDSEGKTLSEGQQTVAHEIGHAIDHQWARDVWNWVDRKSTGTNNGLSEGLNLDLITIPEVRQWVENYFSFIDNISDSGNIHSEYLQSKNEVFARFVAQFVDWTVQIATGRSAIYSFSDFNDKFTMAQFVEFAKILQEKAKLDTKYRKPEASESSRKNIKFSRKEKDNIYHFINKFARIEISWNESNDTYHLYCENSKGYLEYEGTLTEEQIESRFGEELGLDLEQKAWEKDGGVATLDRSWIEYYADEIKPEEKYDDDYLAEAKEEYGTTDNVFLAGYINTDGSMLDFSGGYESRFIDHSEIDVIFDDESGADAMYAYMSMGNIRLMPEAPSLEFNSKIEPTSQQYDTIETAIETLIEKHGKFFIEFSTNDGSSVANRQYERGVPTSKILDDITYFYKNGKLPYQSELSQFRYSRKVLDDTSKPTYYHLSDGQIKKMLANNTRYKVYSKADAEGIINNVLQNYMSFGEKYGDMSGKTKAQVIDMLWKGLNSAKPGYQMGVALHIADYIIQNSVLESLYGDMENYDVQQALDIIGALKPYLHRINLDSIKGEIKYKYDKDNSAYLLWGKRKGESGIGADQIAQELQEKGIQIEAINVADIFFEIDSQYRNAIKSLKKKAKDMLAETLSKEQLKSLRQDIAKEVLRGFDYTGKSSQLAGVLDKYRKQISTLYDKLRDSNRHNRATNRLLDKVQKIKNWKTGAFVNSSKYRTKLFKGSIERLAMIKNRGNLNQSGTRRILAGLAEWYAKDNPILGYVDGENVGHYNEEIASILQAVAQNQKPLTDEQVDLIAFLQEKSGISDYKGLLEWYTKDNLKKGYSAEVKSLLRELASETTFTTEELIALDKVVGYFGHLIENHNKVIRNGKYVDAKPIAERYIDTLQRNKGVKVGWFGKFFDKVFNNGKASYLQTFADPMTVARYMDKYESGFFTEMLEELRNGAIRADVTEMQIRMPLEEFLAKHKKYGRGVSKRTVTYRGVELPALDAFLLYMTLNREQALGGLAEAGFTFNNGKETIRVDGFAKGEELTLPELRERAKAEQDELYKQFTEEDREYISIAEKIFNEDCREAKIETDILRQGYSNVAGYYIPINRANSAKTIDSSSFFDEGNRVSDASFNKDTVQGAKGELYIEGLDEVLDRHIHGISLYAGLATVIDQYDILYNLNMSEDANKPITVRTESENTWAKGNDYFKKLISDLQGISPTRGGGSKLFGFFRGHYATYQLGLSPKVWFTQLSSFFASGSILDYSSIVKGFGIKAPDVDDYCSLAAVRNNDNSAAMAQSVLDKVDKFGSALMKPIGMVDRLVIKKLFGACQVQVEKESGLKIGTKENKVKAGELLQRVILETQQNSMATERSAAMRSGSELMKTLTMFTADSMKVFGRVVDSLGEVSVLKAKIKETTDSKVRAELEEKLKAAKKKSVKSVAALATTAIFMALIAQAFRWLYNKDDDDENIPANMAVDAIGNLMGGLPLIKDLYAKLTEGYDLNNYSYSALNDLFDAFSGTISTVTSLAKGEEVKPLRTVKELSYAVGQILGLPTRNVYNIIYGLTKRISPSTAYGWDSNLYNKNYSTDLQKAIDNDDDDMLATIVGLMLNEKVGGIDNSFAREEMDRLVKGGYKVLPKSVGNTIIYDGEEVAITSKQREQFKKVYGEANKALASLVNDKSYASASDEVKAKAVRFIYDIYYNLAIEDLLGVDLETKNILFAKAIDISSLAIIVATARSIEADTDKKGNIISGSRKKKVQTYINSLGLKAAQKYMIMGYLGYSNKNGQQQVKSYIQRLSLTKSEKEKLYEYSGYAT